jgi:dTMP kinase
MRATRRFHAARELWACRDFRRLVASQGLGGLGEWIATFALLALVWQRTHSAIVSGMVLSLRILPAAVIGTFLGRLVDRLDRRRVLVACTAGRACVYGAIPFVGGIAAVLGLALVAEVASIAYIAARDATLPRLVSPEYLPAANAVSMVSAYGSMPIGSGLFALLVWAEERLWGPGQMLALSVSSILLLLATMLIGRVRAASGSAPREESGEAPAVGSFAAVREIFRADPVLRRVALGGIIAASGGGAIITLGMAYVRDTLHAGPAAYSGLLTAFALGAMAGVAAVQRTRRHLPHVFYIGIATMGAVLVGMALFPTIAMGMGTGFAFGGAFVASFLGGITMLQERIHDSLRGRTFAIAHSGLRVGSIAVGVLAAWIAKMLGPKEGFLSMDGTQAVLGIVGLLLFAGATLLVRPARVHATAA